MAEIISTKVGEIDGMDFDQALAYYGLQRSDLKGSLDNAAAKYRRECNKYRTSNDEELAGSKRKVESIDDLSRPKRERNYLPEEKALAVMKEIIGTYGVRSNAQQNDREEELRRELEAITTSKERIHAAQSRIQNEKK